MARQSLGFRDILGKRSIPGRLELSGGVNIRKVIKANVKILGLEEIEGRFMAAISRANERIAIDLKKALDEAMSSEIWRTPSGRADIIDSGTLRDSGRVLITTRGISVEYTAPYAALVHFGGYINPYGNIGLRVYLPPRPWVEAVLDSENGLMPFDFSKYYKEELEREF